MNVILGVSKNLSAKVLYNWYWSMHSFTCKKVLLCLDQQVPEDLKNFPTLEVIHYPTEDIKVHHERYYYGWKYLKDNCRNSDLVLWTDVSDVYFQSNPFDFFIKNCSKTILIGAEGVNIENEPWNSTNIQKCFPKFVNSVYKKDVLCSGVMMGVSHSLSDLLMDIYNYSAEISADDIIDQAALNTLQLRVNFNNNIHITNPSKPFVVHCQVGGPTEFWKSWNYEGNFKYDKPVFDNKLEEVRTKEGDLYSMVHQYNRIPEWFNILSKKAKKANEEYLLYRSNRRD